ncbi:structural protein VP6 [Sulfolobus polyhedral virus 1]|uniref:Structural protein VP6 n=1 Tax=Sulfolobus polyhedral virus 1 TaxID=1982658 RepID=A0A1W6I188_SPV1|nr:structural protein VP6 [Sulfolobus polyhedral virus 1]ARM37823.1 structural protein VP6 [Sulfolobus polyhedral virus 1]
MSQTTPTIIGSAQILVQIGNKAYTASVEYFEVEAISNSYPSVNLEITNFPGFIINGNVVAFYNIGLAVTLYVIGDTVKASSNANTVQIQTSTGTYNNSPYTKVSIIFNVPYLTPTQVPLTVTLQGNYISAQINFNVTDNDIVTYTLGQGTIPLSWFPQDVLQYKQFSDGIVVLGNSEATLGNLGTEYANCVQLNNSNYTITMYWTNAGLISYVNANGLPDVCNNPSGGNIVLGNLTLNQGWSETYNVTTSSSLNISGDAQEVSQSQIQQYLSLFQGQTGGFPTWLIWVGIILLGAIVFAYAYKNR